MSQVQTPSTDWPDTILDLLQRQHKLVDELSQLADRQADLIRDGHTDALLGLLTQRQTVIERFTATQVDLGRLTGDLDARLRSVDEDVRERIQSLISDIGERLTHVMQRDERDQRTLESARDKKKREIASLDSGRQARYAYLGPKKTTNRFADTQG